MGLVDTMKKVAENTNAAGAPTAWFFGKVTKTSPLTIRVDNRFDISGEAIVVPKELQAGYYPTHYHTGMKGGPSTEEKGGGSGEAAFASHSHVLKNNYQTNTDKTSDYRRRRCGREYPESKVYQWDREETTSGASPARAKVRFIYCPLRTK